MSGGCILAVVLLEGLLAGMSWWWRMQQDHLLRQKLSAASAVRILCVGESTTAIGGTYSYPSQLQSILNKQLPGKSITVLNGGLIGADSIRLVRHLEEFLRSSSPDIVVVMMGINDTDPVSRELMNWRSAAGWHRWKISRFFLIGYYRVRAWAASWRNGPYVSHFGMKEPAVAASPQSESGTLLLPQPEPGWAVAGALSGGLLSGRGDSCTPSQGDDASATVRMVRNLLSQSRYDQARKVLSGCIRRYPQNDEAFALLGCAESSLGNFHAAQQSFSRALELNDRNAVACAGMGWLERDRGNGTEAGHWFERALSFDPENQDALIGLGWIKIDEQRYLEARGYFERVVQLNVQREDALIGLGWVSKYQGNYARAQSLFERALAINPRNDRALTGLGWVLRESGACTKSLDCFQRALMINSRADGAWDGLALAWLDCLECAETPVSEQWFEEIIRNARDVHTLLGAANWYLRQGQILNAQKIIDRIFVWDKDNAPAKLAQAQLLIDRSDYAAAEVLLKQLLEQGYYPVPVKRLFAWCLRWQYQFTAALQYFGEILRQNPNDEDALIGTIWCLKESGQTAEAERRIQDAVERFPESWRVYEVWGWVLYAQRRYADAREKFEFGNRQPGVLSQCRVGMALCDVRLAKADESLRLAEELLADNRYDFPAALLQGYCLLELGRWEQARDWFCGLSEQGRGSQEQILLGWAQCEIALNNFSAAQALLQKVVQANPLQAEAKKMLASLSLQTSSAGDTSETMYREIMQEHPLDTPARVSVAKILLREHRDDEAMRILDEAVALNPQEEEGYELIAQVSLKDGDLHRAEQAYQSILAENPGSRLAGGGVWATQRAQGKPVYSAARQVMDVPYFSRKTVRNYQRMYRMLSARGIRMICVSYPHRSVASLRTVLGDLPGLDYVDCGEVFAQGMRVNGADYYFRDRFAGDFGHCTPEGNQLLANEVARAVETFINGTE